MEGLVQDPFNTIEPKTLKAQPELQDFSRASSLQTEIATLWAVTGFHVRETCSKAGLQQLDLSHQQH